MKLKEAIFDLNKESFCGLDGFPGKFYQAYWKIIKDGMINMIIIVLYGYEISRYITHTTLVLIPKKETIVEFWDLKPISLRTSMNKIISKVIHGRLVQILPKIILNKQSGFMKGWNVV